MTERTDLVVPAGLVADLDIPPLAVTDGSADPEWAEVPLGFWAFRRRPSQRLPLDPRTARNTRRWVRLAPWTLLTTVIAKTQPPADGSTHRTPSGG